MLDIKLIKFESGLVYQVTYQGPEVKAFIESTKNKMFKASNGWKIKMSYVPEIDRISKTIYLRGSNNTSDLRLTAIHVASNLERDRLYEDIETTLAEFADAIETPIKPKIREELPISVYTISPNRFFYEIDQFVLYAPKNIVEL